MSQLRENLKPGLEAERLDRHVGQANNSTAESAVNVNIVVEPPSPEGVGPPGGHDSDPPIENENPNEGDECFDKSFNSTLSTEERGKAVENAKKRAQSHHRKRKKSTHNGDGNYIPPYKKNRGFRRQVSVLPSKFLLGGNIRDPLNLASLSDARISAELNQVTPHSSPLPIQGQIPIFIPKNPYDPLGLTRATPENPGDIVAGVRANNKCRKHRHRKRPGRKRTDSECSIGTEITEGGEEEQEESKRKRRISDQLQSEDDDDDEVDRGIPEGRDRKQSRSTSEPPVGMAKAKGTAGPSNADKRPGLESGVPAADKVQVPRDNEDEQLADKKTDSPKQKSEGAVSGLNEEGGSFRDENPPSTPNIHPDPEPVLESPMYSAHDYYPVARTSEYYPSRSSEYVPMSSTYAPSPFAFDADVDYDDNYYGSPSFSCYQYTPTHELEPFSPPTRPEMMMPVFERQMQMFASRPPPMSLQRAMFQRPFNRKRFRQKADPIVSPVVPQPGSRRRNHGHHHNNHNEKKRGEKHDGNVSNGGGSNGSGEGEKKYRPKDQIFQFGNYSHYYGYRTPDQGDPRLWILKKSFFEGKDVLDIGCNTGHVTLSIARDFEPRRVRGIDIDFSLITAARRNIKHYMTRDPENKNVVFPKSLPMIYGAMQPPPGCCETTPNPFPYNVSFDHENYVLASDALLEKVKPEYDVIVCLSVTKWIHLNFGDDGIKRFFRRVYAHLRDGGKFIMEPQPWSSYTKKKKLTEKIHQTYKSIEFLPDKFNDFLLTDVGFASKESLGTPAHNSKGFQRPLLMFTKATVSDESPNSRSPLPAATASTSQTTNSNNSKPVATPTRKTASCTVTSRYSPSSSPECTSTICSSTDVTQLTVTSVLPSSSETRQDQQESEVTSTESPGEPTDAGETEQETMEVVSSSSDCR